MSTNLTQRRRAAGRPLKSPLAVAGDYTLPDAGGEEGTQPATVGTMVTERGVTLAEFEEYLRTVNNRDGRPYEEKTINAYTAPARHLDRWLATRGIDGDFTAADTALLNRYFREYYLEHGHPTPYNDGLKSGFRALFHFLPRGVIHSSKFP